MATMCSQTNECAIKVIIILMASNNEEYELMKDLKVLHISVYFLPRIYGG